MNMQESLKEGGIVLKRLKKLFKKIVPAEKLIILSVNKNIEVTNQMQLMVLKHDPKYNRDKDIAAKIREESLELQSALKFHDTDQIVDEALDLITVAINAINKQAKQGTNIMLAIAKHQSKLKIRGWEEDNILYFNIGKEKL